MNNSDSNKSAFEWKKQVSDMMKDIHESIMVDAKELLNENMKECLKQITYNVKNTIDVAIPPLVVRNIQTTLTPSSQLTPITQDTPQPTLRIEDVTISSMPWTLKIPPTKGRH